MSRVDWKRGRFTTATETADIRKGLRGTQAQIGDVVLWWRFNNTDTVVHDVYDEGIEGGLAYDGPIEIPVLHATFVEGAEEQLDRGLYATDTLQITASLHQLRKRGMTDIELNHTRYLRDRVAYNGRLFRVGQVEVLGQIRRDDVIVAIHGPQVQADELSGDADFAAYEKAARRWIPTGADFGERMFGEGTFGGTRV